ncbi:hypothetical protein GLE_5442 [Lysobacter enzymogenes]|uniref:Uncharacterized protein n=1 Tax=Lysobacter enzymogenes TaxID=69 RepID=A0A0S2DR33_LYSEN|nr:hypothetical protein [Lysobacter enzymogenes]ALN60783.1 hypothetical protein GLE_5442 [Lysobacter enzymogenes]QCW24361.1 hypothetical protein FE772_00440 [Lysobacter enzymogenes]
MRTKAAKALRLGLGSLLLLALAATAFVATNWSGGELAAALGLPRGGAPRLGWDLAWTVAAGALALWIVARWAPVAARAQVALAWLALAAMAVWAVANLGGEFPLWFCDGLLAALPLLGGCAWRWAGLPRRSQRHRA